MEAYARRARIAQFTARAGNTYVALSRHRQAVLDAPVEPVVDDGAGEKDPDAAGQRT